MKIVLYGEIQTKLVFYGEIQTKFVFYGEIQTKKFFCMMKQYDIIVPKMQEYARIDVRSLKFWILKFFLLIPIFGNCFSLKSWIARLGECRLIANMRVSRVLRLEIPKNMELGSTKYSSTLSFVIHNGKMKLNFFQCLVFRHISWIHCMEYWLHSCLWISKLNGET